MPETTRIGFQDVRDEVLRRIRTRVWAQGDVLPTEIELAEEFGVARATVNRALRELADQGVIDRKRKSGTRVVETPVKQAKLEIQIVRQLVEDQNAAYRYALVHRTAVPCPDWLASRLGLPTDQPVLHLKCMHFADNQPFQFEERWINIAAVPDVAEADFSDVGPNEWLLRAVPFTEAEIAFSAISADNETAAFLGSHAGAAHFQMERTTWLQGQPVTYVRMIHPQGYKMATRY
jgi:GntR family histidine utilization transcriptional repressor